MVLTKEEVYVPLEGKSKEELTELIKICDNVFLSDYNFLHFNVSANEWWGFKEWSNGKPTKQEVTIQQLKEILQPMENKRFTPIAMKCTKEQFEAIKPKLKKLGKIGLLIEAFSTYNYLCNNYGNERNYFDFITGNKEDWFSSINIFYETWNEEIFLKACGIEVETLEQQRINELIDDGYIVMETCVNLSRELPLNEYLQQKLSFYKQKVEETEKAIEEENKIKVGDWCINKRSQIFKIKVGLTLNGDFRKITNPQLIELLERECTS